MLSSAFRPSPASKHWIQEITPTHHEHELQALVWRGPRAAVKGTVCRDGVGVAEGLAASPGVRVRLFVLLWGETAQLGEREKNSPRSAAAHLLAHPIVSTPDPFTPQGEKSQHLRLEWSFPSSQHSLVNVV